RVLITGAAGFLGEGLVQAFDGHDLRLLDVVEAPGPGEKLVGSVPDAAVCQRAMEGMDALIIAHMAPRRRGLYATPQVPFEVNVTGTVNLYVAAREAGVKRVVLISSIAVVKRHQDARVFLRRDLPLETHTHPYGLTKACQE